MTPPTQNARGAQVLALAAVSAGVWYFAARSLHVSLTQARAEIAADRAEITDHDAAYSPDIGDPAKAMLELAERQKRVESLARISGDAAKVYEALGAIAATCNVRVERVEPTRSGARDTRAAASAKNADFTVTTESTHYVIDAVGQYADLAKFIRAMEQDLGVTKVVSFRFAPAPVTQGAPPTIAASIETAHFKLITTNKPAPGAQPKEQAK